jgi:hypothetical protein
LTPRIKELGEEIADVEQKRWARGSSLAMTYSPTPPGSEIHTDS